MLKIQPRKIQHFQPGNLADSLRRGENVSKISQENSFTRKYEISKTKPKKHRLQCTKIHRYQFTLIGDKLILKNGLAKGTIKAIIYYIHLISLLNCPNFSILRGFKRVSSSYLSDLTLTSQRGFW